MAAVLCGCVCFGAAVEFRRCDLLCRLSRNEESKKQEWNRISDLIAVPGEDNKTVCHIVKHSVRIRFNVKQASIGIC